MKRYPLAAFFALILVMLTGVAAAVQPQRWTHTTEADFDAGEVDGTVVTNLGDIQLAAASDTLDELPEGVTIVYDVEVVDGVTYLAAGPEGRLLKVESGEVSEVAAFEGEQVFCLDTHDGALLIGVSGERARLVLLHEDEPLEVTSFPEARYLWDIVVVGNDTLIATGPEGVVYRVQDVDGYATAVKAGNPAEPPAFAQLLDTAQANVLCLAAGPDGVIYAGTDTEGLIYRIDAQGNAYIAYDANEPEIGALLVLDDGTVYAGTADANQARPGQMAEPIAEETGRPEAQMPDVVDEIDEPQPEPLQPGADTAVTPDEPAAAEDDAPEAQPVVEPVEPPTPATTDPGDKAEEDTPQADDAEPTDEQLDELRELIRQKLLAARESGTIKPSSSTGQGAERGRPTRAAAAPTGETEGGNAVYKIDPEGFVSTIFRESVMVLSLAEHTGDDGLARILIATGSEGQIFSVNPQTGETAILTDLEVEQVMTLQRSGDRVVIGTANPASLITLKPGIAPRGTYTSDVLDAKHISLWGSFNLTAEVPDGASVTVETRSGNVADPEAAPWSEWSTAQVFMPDDQASPLQPREVEVAAPPARFLQYRLTLTADGTSSPVVGKVQLAYVTPNLRPKVRSITESYPDPPNGQAPATTMNIEWEATDPNGDRLLYKLEYQPARSEKWLLVDDALTETGYEWQTRDVPDGYYLLRVTADDRLDNPGTMAMQAARRSDPVLVDNTPPAISKPGEADGRDDGGPVVVDRVLQATYVASDALSAIRSISYTLDNAPQPTPLLPDDLIFDSTREIFTVTIPDLAPGPHALTLHVSDTRGNTTHHPVLFEVD